MLYMAIGGIPLMFLYKGINTMDSMLGYKNDKYLHFGRCAARLDDVANYIPARISGWLMVAGAFVIGLDSRNASRIFKRPSMNVSSFGTMVLKGKQWIRLPPQRFSSSVARLAMVVVMDTSSWSFSF